MSISLYFSNVFPLTSDSSPSFIFLHLPHPLHSSSNMMPMLCSKVIKTEMTPDAGSEGTCDATKTKNKTRRIISALSLVMKRWSRVSFHRLMTLNEAPAFSRSPQKRNWSEKLQFSKSKTLNISPHLWTQRFPPTPQRASLSRYWGYILFLTLWCRH